MNALYFIMISGVLVAMVEIIKRKFSLPPNITRKITHIGATTIAAISPIFIDKTSIVIVCLLFSLVVLFCRKTDFLTSIHGIKRASFGDVLLPLGEAVAALIFLPHDIAAFQYGVLVMGISDALASLVGEHFARHKIHFLGITKSLEGSIAFFVSALLLTIFFSPIFGYQLLAISALLTLAEFLGLYGSDNLVLPILGASLIHMLG